MKAAKPYAEGIRRVIGHLSQASPDFHNPYLEERKIKRIGYIVVTSDRGLCGSLNVNLFRALLNDISEWQKKGVEVDLCLLGAKGVAFFRRLKTNIVSVATHLGDMAKDGGPNRADNKHDGSLQGRNHRSAISGA